MYVGINFRDPEQEMESNVLLLSLFVPQFSSEELEELRSGAWENPAFDNMDQLMDERSSHSHTH